MGYVTEAKGYPSYGWNYQDSISCIVIGLVRHTRPSIAITDLPAPGPINPKASVLLCPGTAHAQMERTDRHQVPEDTCALSELVIEICFRNENAPVL